MESRNNDLLSGFVMVLLLIATLTMAVACSSGGDDGDDTRAITAADDDDDTGAIVATDDDDDTGAIAATDDDDDTVDNCVDTDCDGFGEGCEAGADCDGSDPLVFPGAPELPLDGLDNDCAGDGDLVPDETNGVFVDGAGGLDANPGTRAEPVATIAHGVELAEANGYANVYIAAGDYNEVVKTTVSLFGGYEAAGWTRNSSVNVTRIVGPSVGLYIPDGSVAAIEGMQVLTPNPEPLNIDDPQFWPEFPEFSVVIRGEVSVLHDVVFVGCFARSMFASGRLIGVDIEVSQQRDLMIFVDHNYLSGDIWQDKAVIVNGVFNCRGTVPVCTQIYNDDRYPTREGYSSLCFKNSSFDADLTFQLWNTNLTLKNNQITSHWNAATLTNSHLAMYSNSVSNSSESLGNTHPGAITLIDTIAHLEGNYIDNSNGAVTQLSLLYLENGHLTAINNILNQHHYYGMGAVIQLEKGDGSELVGNTLHFREACPNCAENNWEYMAVGIQANDTENARIINNILNTTVWGAGIGVMSSTLAVHGNLFNLDNAECYDWGEDDCYSVLYPEWEQYPGQYDSSMVLLNDNWTSYENITDEAEVNGCEWTGCLSASDNIQGDALFTDPDGDDFTTPANSPTVDNGVDPSPWCADPAVGHDFEGTARPVGSGWDIGAYEK